MYFTAFANKVRHAKKIDPFIDADTVLLSFDPGHTTGYAVFVGHELSEFSQLETKSIPQATEVIGDLFKKVGPDVVIVEDYRIYKWKTEHHGGSTVLTARVIGCIETIATQHMTNVVIKQPAHTAKGFVTDKRLKEWAFYEPGMKHARDAIRHACYFILFGAIRQSEARGYTVG